MRHSFQTNSGKSTFGTFKESQTGGDYIYNKKAKATYCSGNICVPANTQNNLLLLKRSNYLNYYACSNINTSNLNINLLTKLNLLNVPVVRSNISPFECPAYITTSYYLNYVIDPSGNLFGNSACGYLNFETYLTPN
jgi:hypothetical protein